MCSRDEVDSPTISSIFLIETHQRDGESVQADFTRGRDRYVCCK